MPWLSKNSISIVFTLDFWKHIFFGHGECSPTHSVLCRFVSGSYAKDQLSSPVITLSRNFLSPLIMFNRSLHMATHSSNCSRVIACGTNLEHRCFFISSFEIHRNPVFGMLSVSVINRDITFRSSLNILLTAAMLLLVQHVGRPLRSSSFTDSPPCWNRLCHSKVVVRLNAASP